MSGKSSEKGGGPAPAGAVAAVERPGQVRNVVLVGHSGSGKTTLVEALLAATGTISRAGSVTDGTTVCDSDPAEHRQQRSVTLALAPIEHDEVQVNLLDTPGYADFTGELRAGLRAADAALFVVSAVDGVDASTVTLWEECAHVGMPRAVVITRLDHPRADFDEAVAICQRVFGEGVLPLYLPMHADDGSVAGLIGLLSQRVFDYSGGSYPPVERDPDPEHLSLIEEARNSLIEGIIAESEDETLMDRYLGGEQIDPKVLVDDLETAVARGSFYPVLGVAAGGGSGGSGGSGGGIAGLGMAELLEVLTSAFPSPLEHDVPPVTELDGSPHEPLTCDPDGPLVAEDQPLLIAPWEMPEPLLPIAVQAKTRSDEDALAKGLGRLVAGDPTLRLERNSETHQLVLWCMGEAHADVVLDRLRSAGVDLETVPVRVALREAFTAPATGHGRHVKQSGGHGQFAICDIEVEPLATGGGFEFRDKVVGGAVPNQFIPSVEKGVRAQMDRGVLAGYPLVDVRVTLVDGKAHSVDSSDAAFQTAGALALREAAAAGHVSLLEPVHEVEVTVPDAYVGAIMSDLSGRRGRVSGTEPVAGERTVIRAEVPETELVRYATDLRSITSGTGTFRRSFARYEPMPDHVAQAVLKEPADSS
jgi:elongation factor G